MNKNFAPFPILTTARLVLRQIEPNDASIIFDFGTRGVVSQFLFRPNLELITNVLKVIEDLNRGISEGEFIYWVLNLKGNGRVIGTICLWNLSEDNSYAEIGYELHPDFRGRGLMWEAVEKIIEFGFDKMNLAKIEAWTDSFNKDSIKLLEKSNFVRDIKAKDDRKEANGENMLVYCLKDCGLK